MLDLSANERQMALNEVMVNRNVLKGTASS